MRTILEVDDLWDKAQIEDLLVPLRKANPAVIVNAFAIPNKLGDVLFLKEAYPWIKFCIHGFEHTHYECLEWPYEKATTLLGRAMEMGYEPVFKAPNYYMDREIEDACATAKVVLVHNESYRPALLGTKVYPGLLPKEPHNRLSAHLVAYPGTQDFIKNHYQFSAENLKRLSNFTSFTDFVCS